MYNERYACIYIFSFQELMNDDPKESKNWKSIFIALFVIVTVLGLVITAIVLVTPGNLYDTGGW